MPINFDNIQITGGLNIEGLVVPPIVGDPYWANVSLLMNNTTTNNQTNNTFLDSSTNNFTVTRVGTPTQGSFTPFTVAANTSYSTSTNGGTGQFQAGDYLTLPDNDVWALGTDNFTIEFWMYPNSLSSVMMLVQHAVNSANRWILYYSTTTGISFDVVTASTTTVACRQGSTTGWGTGTWYHVALVRNGNNFNIYRNGISIASVSNNSSSIPNYAASLFVGGGNIGGDSSMIGQLSNLRIVKGTAVYTSNFTPPTSPVTAISGTSLLLNFTNAGIFDGATKNNLTTVGNAKVSTTQAKFYTTSVNFNGSADYLTMNTNSIFAMGTGDFTLEGWIYYTGVTPITNLNGPVIISCRVSGLSEQSNVLSIGLGGNNKLAWSNGTSWLAGATDVSANTWNYVAVTRNSGTIRIFLNGQVDGTFTNQTTNLGTIRPCTIGAFDTGGTGKFTGYMQDVRITKGVARYTANFTPPTTAFPTY